MELRTSLGRNRYTFLVLGVCAMSSAAWALLATPAHAQTATLEPGSQTATLEADPASVEEECWTWDESELALFEDLNEARRDIGLDTLTLDPEISRVAQHHSYDMRVEQRLYHTAGPKLYRRVTKEESLGETVGRGRNADTLFQAFMESDAHRHVILSKDFNHVGLGISYDAGRMWVTLLFEGYTDPGTTMDMSEPCQADVSLIARS